METIATLLIDYESVAADLSDTDMGAAFRVCEKLKLSMSGLTGSTGFRSLLARALTVAKAKTQTLSPLRVNQDGLIDGMDQIPREEARQAGVALIAQLVQLLATLVGECLTLQLLRETWPDLPGSDQDSEVSETA